MRVNVKRTTLCFAAILDYRILSLDAKVSHSLRASSNPIALRCCRVKIIEMFWWFGASRESAHHAHGHGTPHGPNRQALRLLQTTEPQVNCSPNLKSSPTHSLSAPTLPHAVVLLGSDLASVCSSTVSGPPIPASTAVSFGNLEHVTFSATSFTTTRFTARYVCMPESK